MSYVLPPAAVAALAWPPPVTLSATGDAPAKPTVYPFLPSAAKNTGAAVVIVPSRAPANNDEANDGVQLARWLNDRGIAGFVLRPGGSRDDVSAAIRALRSRAGEFKISPRRVALLGFGSGGALATDLVYSAGTDAAAGASAEATAGRPDLVALVWGSSTPEKIAPGAPPVFLVGSTATADGMSGMVDLWTKLRGARVSVDAHFFAQAPADAGLGKGDVSLSEWPEMFFTWARFNGLLTDEPRLPLKGMVYLDGRTIPHGYVVLTPIDFVGAGPIVCRVINSNASAPIGEFTVPANQGPIAGRYKVDVRQNMNRWVSNAFIGGLTGGRDGPPTPEQVHFGHHRLLAPSIDDQKSFTKVRPGDRQDYIVEIKPGADANLNLKLEVFSK